MNNLLNKIKQRQSCSLYGSRRSGKTTLALKIKESLNEELNVAYIDCGLIVKETDLWKILLKKLSLNYVGEFKELDFSFMEGLEEDKSNKLIIFDEFELLVNNSNISVETFNYLRAIANHPEIKLTYLVVSEKRISDLFIHHKNIEFVGSPFFNIFTEYSIDEIQ